MACRGVHYLGEALRFAPRHERLECTGGGYVHGERSDSTSRGKHVHHRAPHHPARRFIYSRQGCNLTTHAGHCKPLHAFACICKHLQAIASHPCQCASGSRSFNGIWARSSTT